MKITLRPGEVLAIDFEDTDGLIEVGYLLEPGEMIRAPTANGIIVTADLEDISGRNGLIYHEPLDDLEDGQIKQPPSVLPKTLAWLCNKAIQDGSKEVDSDGQVIIYTGRNVQGEVLQEGDGDSEA